MTKCACMEKAEPIPIGRYKDSCLCEFGELTQTSKEGEETSLGWGVAFYNYKKGNDHVWPFNFCPWCGAKIEQAPK